MKVEKKSDKISDMRLIVIGIQEELQHFKNRLDQNKGVAYISPCTATDCSLLASPFQI
jgi:hypothetical protein